MYHAIEWDEGNLEHVERHGVRAYEVKEAFEAPHVLLKCKRKRGGRPEHRRVLLGVTLDGRGVFVVFVDKGKGAARPISARDMKRDERRFYDEQVD